MHNLKISKSITNRKEESLHRYLNDIGQFKMINYQEEVKLAQMIRKGDKNAEHRLVIANLRFVISCAKKYQNKGLSLQDLVNEGNIGLIKAAKNFDETRGFKFISYAVWWIRQSILQALGENSSVVRVPISQQIGMRGINKQREKLEQILEREPTLEELAEAMGKQDDQVANYIGSCLHVFSYDDPVSSGEPETGRFLDFMADEEENLFNTCITEEFRTYQLQFMLNRVLKKREQKILCMTFGLFGHQAMNNEDIARDLKLTKERVRQLVKYSLIKLRKTAKNL